MGVWGWWAFEIFTLIASYLGGEVLAGQTIMRSLGLLTFMIPVGFSMATTIKVGHFIGIANLPAIQYYFYTSMCLAIAVAAAQILALMLAETGFQSIFTTKDSDVAK
jgi:MATE family multidrug resistance protein